MKLKNRKILITGGSDGVGLALTKLLISLNNEVIICGRDQAKLDNVQSSLSDVICFQCDLSKEDEIDRLRKFILNEHSDLSVLINNAGVQLNNCYLESAYTEAKKEIEWEMAVNFLAPVFLVSGLYPILEEKSQAAIINVTSGLALNPKASAPIYCASKAALRSFTRSLRFHCEDSHSNVRVFEAILPLVDTQMTKGRGSRKMSPEAVSRSIIRSIEADRYEIRVGKVKLLTLLNRITPSLADHILRRS